MKRLNAYVNSLVNITLKNKNGHTNSLSGYITHCGKDWILFLDQDKNERPFKKESVSDVKLIATKA